MRRRWPSMTWKWIRTVSPALNWGRSPRSCRRSSCSMTLLMTRGPERPSNASGTGPGRTPGGRGSAEPESIGRPVDGEHLADDVLPGHRAPLARVAGLLPVVAHEEVLALRHLPAARAGVAPIRLQVGLDELADP